MTCRDLSLTFALPILPSCVPTFDLPSLVLTNHLSSHLSLLCVRQDFYDLNMKLVDDDPPFVFNSSEQPFFARCVRVWGAGNAASFAMWERV